MRLAIISDVHGNVRALEAVLADIRSRGVDATVNLGDCVAGPTWPRECFECLAALRACQEISASRRLLIRRDGVVPLPVEVITRKVQHGQFLFGHFDPCRIFLLV